jgi:hypothetical protein
MSCEDDYETLTKNDGKKVVTYYSSIYWKGMRKIMKNLS